MLKNPQASILISSYNKGNYLEQCIKSCLSQTQKNIEVILLDNHSNDKTNVVNIIQRIYIVGVSLSKYFFGKSILR